jgi:hypothetical protein
MLQFSISTLTDITLWKNSTSGWNRIVKIWLKIENGPVVNEITWTNTNIRNRATTINQKVSPSSQAKENVNSIHKYLGKLIIFLPCITSNLR